MKRSLGCIAAVLVLAGCSGSGGNTGGGAGGGGGSGGATGGGTGGGTAGGSGGSGGGTAGGSGVGGGSGAVPFGQLCQQMSDGYRKETIEPYRACGADPTLNEDVAHQALISGVGSTPTTFTYDLLWSTYLGCGPGAADGGSFLALILEQLADSVDAGRIVYDGAKAQSCALKSTRDGGLAPECSDVFTPRALLGSGCARTEDCFPDAYCKPAAAASCGGQCVSRLAAGLGCEPTRDQCVGGGACSVSFDGGYHCAAVVPRDGGIGDRCFGSSPATCSPELSCVANNAMPTLPDGGPNAFCAAPVGDGLPCGTGGAVPRAPACASPCSSCFTSDAGVTGVCRAKGGPGTACELDQDCLPFHNCLAGSCVLAPRPGESCIVKQVGSQSSRGNCRWADNYCRPSAADAGIGLCTSLPTLTQACGSRFDLTSVCATGSCETVAGVGQCKPTPTLGQSCGSGFSCASGLRCVTGASPDGGALCQALPTAGMPCTGTCDSSSRCVTNTCVAKFGAGSVCGADDECLSANCLPGQKICAAQCDNPFGKGITTTGCPNGLRDVSILLGWSTLGLFLAGKRRRR